MDDESGDHGKPEAKKSEDLMTRLKAPMTVTAPTWAFAAAGLVGIVLLISAFD